MRVPRLHTPQPLPLEQTIVLEAAASHYVGKVLRMQEQQEIILFNGLGEQVSAHIVSISKKAVSVFVNAPFAGPTASPLHTHLGQVMSRGERMDYAIQKATELGVNQITPLFSNRCEVKLDPKRQIKRLAHWQQISISACEQSGRIDMPVIHEPQTLDTWLKNTQADAKLVLHPHQTKPLKSQITPLSCALLIGPEGGLTEPEVEQAQAHGYTGLSLGPRILRTETAPLAALTLLQYVWGDLHH
ncbi:MAG: 16S rRNA (uracil(1498)-N(3))-methyltransferase [Gammaproteobacteria bacterium]|nr:16S rRNA (uracil(1498)-N(3))-methyltransferase [Gammaproteobacteria bacterium]